MATRKKKLPERDDVLEQSFEAVIGIDTSMTTTGIAVLEFEIGGGHHWETSRIMSKATLDTITWRSRRVNKIVNEFPQHMPGIAGHYLAVIEEPTFTSGGSGFDRAFVWHGIVKFLLENGHHVIQVNNSTGKVYTVGRGSSVEKGEIVTQVIRRYPTADVIDDNVADAVGLAAMGARLIGRPVEESLPQTHLRAMDTVRKRLGL